MRALVTGGAGFIGSTLVDRLLAEGHAVDVVDDLSAGSLKNLSDARSDPNHDFKFHRLDLSAPELVELVVRRKPDVVFHLGAQSSVSVSVSDPMLDARSNVLGTVTLLEGARRAEVRKVVYAASGGTIYGDVAEKDLPVRESHPQRPLSPYGVSKMAAHDYLHAYRDLYDLEFTSLALANVYGPRQDPHGEAGVVAIFSERLLDSRTCTIFGDGRQTRDFVFVDDVVDAFVRASGERGGGLLINVGTGVETSVNELYTAMARAAGITLAAEHVAPRAGDLLRSSLDPGRAEMQLGWKPWTSVDEGTMATLRWAHEHRPPQPAAPTSEPVAEPDPATEA